MTDIWMLEHASRLRTVLALKGGTREFEGTDRKWVEMSPMEVARGSLVARSIEIAVELGHDRAVYPSHEAILEEMRRRGG